MYLSPRLVGLMWVGLLTLKVGELLDVSSGGGVIVAALSRSTKTIFGFLKLDNELLKVTKFGNSRYLFPWKIAD